MQAITPEVQNFMCDHPFVVVTVFGYRTLYRTPIFWRNLVLLAEVGAKFSPCQTLTDLESCDIVWHETEKAFLKHLEKGA